MKKIISLAVLGLFLILGGSVFASAQSKPKISMKQARTIALKRATGKIESAELEKEKGKLIYSFDIRNNKGTITEVQVNALNGEIVSVQEESKQQEKDEKRQEKQEKSKTNKKN